MNDDPVCDKVKKKSDVRAATRRVAGDDVVGAGGFSASESGLASNDRMAVS